MTGFTLALGLVLVLVLAVVLIVGLRTASSVSRTTADPVGGATPGRAIRGAEGSPEWFTSRRMAQQQILRKRIAAATVLDLYADDRRHLLDAHITFYGHPAENVIALREDVQEWLNANVQGWGRIPSEITPLKGEAIFFDQPDDAVAFKLRWY